MHIILVTALFFILHLLPCLSHAQKSKSELELNDSSDTLFWHQYRNDSLWSLKSKKGLIPMTWNNLWYQAKSPGRINKSSSVILLASAGITTMLFYYDLEIDKAFRPLKDEHPLIGDLSPQITELGDYYGYSFLILSGGFSFITKNHKLLHTTALAGEAALLAGIWARVGKVLTGRMRPGATYGDLKYTQGHWFGPFAEFNPTIRNGRSIASFDAFPSGHTAAAFSIAAVFATSYSNHKAVPWIAYSLSSMVAITRMIEHEHWASDLLPGALIGYACGRQVVNNYRDLYPEYGQKKYSRKAKLTGLNIAPSLNHKGFICRFTF